MKSLLPIALALLCFTCRASEPIRILSWNIESGGSDTTVIIDQLKTQMPKHDIVALSEVPSNAIEPIAKALGWKHFGGADGGEDRLLIAWSDRFVFLRKIEIADFQVFHSPKPLIVALTDSQSEKKLIVVNNRLVEQIDHIRHDQTNSLRDWVDDILLSETFAISVGDIHGEFDIKNHKMDETISSLQRIEHFFHWKWIEPEKLIDTNWRDLNGDGKDDTPNSISDHVFVSSIIKRWKVKSEIIVREGDFPDNQTTSDHRPILVTFQW